MKVLIFLVVLCVFSTAKADLIPRGQVRALENDLRANDFAAMAIRADAMLDTSLHFACDQMTAAGDSSDAWEICQTYDAMYKGLLTRAYAGKGLRHDIGSHPEEELIAWISIAYKKIESVLGRDLCKALHISDIYTLNETLRVAFSCKTFPMDGVTGSREDEWVRNMNTDGIYDGLFPILVYWAIDIGCTAGTSGTAAMACGPIAGLGELFCEDVVCSHVAEFLFTKFCE